MSTSVSLVTGAAGFIGSHLVRQLLSRGETVHAIVRPNSGLERIADVEDDITVHRVDLADYGALRACLSTFQPRKVYHLAAKTRLAGSLTATGLREAVDQTLETTLNLVDVLAGLSHPPDVVVRSGSLAEYGPSPVPSREDGPASPITAYGAAMLATTAALGALRMSFPFPVITARLSLCYGPGQSRAFLIADAIARSLEGREITLTRPDDRRDLIHVEDVVRGLVEIADQVPADCPVINLCSTSVPRMGEVADTIAHLCGRTSARVNHAPRSTDGPPVELRCSSDLARRRIGWTPRLPLEEGLRQTIETERRAMMPGHVPAGA